MPSRALRAARAEEQQLRRQRLRLGAMAVACFLAPAVRTAIGRFVAALAPQPRMLWLEMTFLGIAIGAGTLVLAMRQRARLRLAELRVQIFTLEFLRDTLEIPFCPPANAPAANRPPLRVILGTMAEPAAKTDKGNGIDE